MESCGAIEATATLESGGFSGIAVMITSGHKRYQSCLSLAFRGLGFTLADEHNSRAVRTWLRCPRPLTYDKSASP